MKELVIIAGPNGSGKSTLASQIDFAGDYINADKCEKNFLLHITNNETRERQAVLMVAKEISEHIKLDLPFAFETVFATNTIPSFLKTAKDKGYVICLHYVSTDNVDINIERVAKRVSEGGHNVPPKKIIDRYHKTLGLLPELLNFADKAIIYDNSSESIRAFLVKEHNEVKVIDTPPEWAKAGLLLF